MTEVRVGVSDSMNGQRKNLRRDGIKELVMNFEPLNMSASRVRTLLVG